MTKLKKNIAINYLSQAYLSLIGIFVLPLFLNYLGSEPYGLVSFFAMLQVWFGMLDAGLTPTLTRETAKYLIDRKRREQFVALFFLFIAIISSIGFLVFVIIGSLSEVIANTWLETSELNSSVVEFSILVIACVIPCRLISTVLKGVLLGSDFIPWLSISNIVFATLKFPAAFLSFYFFGFDVKVFFVHQLLISLLEVLVLIYKSFSILDFTLKEKLSLKKNAIYLRTKLKFAFSISFTTVIWIGVTQADKLVLSGMLTLSEYGHYSLAVLLGSAVLVVTSPLGTVLMPRLVRLNETKSRLEYEQLYRKSSSIVAALGIVVASTLFFYSNQIIFLWTGDTAISQKANEITSVYALGNLLLCVSSFGYYLQYSKGNLKYHVRGNVLFLLTFVPVLVIISYKYGGLGAAYSWLAFNFFFLFFWVSYVHKKFLDFSFFSWIATSFLRLVFPVFITGFFLDSLLNPYLNLFAMLSLHLSITAVVLFVFSSDIRGLVSKFFIQRDTA